MLKKQKVYKVELLKRLGNKDNLVNGKIWDTTWIDLTDYFIERLDTVSTSLDDFTLQGKLEQSSTTLRFDNVTGKFNPRTTVDSLWETSGYVYHSRIRLWEYYEDEDIEALGLPPLMDGLIAEEFKYREGMLVDIRINSKLDILRNHYILENGTARINRIPAQSILKYIVNLLDNTYSELGIITTGGLLRNEVIYDELVAYSKDLLKLFNTIILEGGGIGGLDRYSTLFSTYFGATPNNQQYFQSDGNTEALYYFDYMDYIEGEGSTIYDQSGNNHIITTVQNGSDLPAWVSGFYTKAQSYAVETIEHVFASSLSMDTYWISIIIKLTANNTCYNIPLSGDDLFFPLFMWTSFNGDTYGSGILPSAGAGVTSDQFAEGFCINYDGFLTYLKATFTGVSGNTDITTEVPLGKIVGENFWTLVDIGVDYSNNKIYFGLNGKVKSVINIATGLLNTVTKNRFAFNQDSISAFSAALSIKVSQLRIQNTFTPGNFDTDIFSQYKNTFGSEYQIGV